VKGRIKKVSEIRAEHEEFTLGKVDDFSGLVNHHQAHGNGRVGIPVNQAADDLLKAHLKSIASPLRLDFQSCLSALRDSFVYPSRFTTISYFIKPQALLFQGFEKARIGARTPRDDDFICLEENPFASRVY